MFLITVTDDSTCPGFSLAANVWIYACVSTQSGSGIRLPTTDSSLDVGWSELHACSTECSFCAVRSKRTLIGRRWR